LKLWDLWWYAGGGESDFASTFCGGLQVQIQVQLMMPMEKESREQDEKKMI